MKPKRKIKTAGPVEAPGKASPTEDSFFTGPWSNPAIFVCIVAFAFVLRLIYLFQIESFPLFYNLASDARRYDEWAMQIAGGDWLGRGVFYQAPLYPYFLGVLQSIAGHDLWFIRVAQIVLGALSCGFLYLAGTSFFSRSAGVTAGLILAVYAPAVFFDGLVQKTVLDIFFVALILAILGGAGQNPTWTKFIAVGALLGLLGLTRENALILAAVFPVWIWFQFSDRPSRARLGWIAVFVAGLSLVLLPVGLRNLKAGGEFKWTTSQFGPNFYIGNNPLANGEYSPLRSGHGDPDFERQDATELAEQAAGRALTPGEVSNYWTRRSMEFIRSDPGAWLGLLWRKWMLVWNAREIADADDFYMYETVSGLLNILGWPGQFSFLAPLAALGIFLTWREWRRLWLLYLLLLAFAFSVAIFYVFARYRFPMVPILALFAGAGIMAARDLIRHHATTQLVSAAAIVIAAFFLVRWPVAGRPGPSSAGYSNLGNALLKQEKFDEAVEMFDRALRIDPTDAVAHYNMGNAMLALNKFADAARHFEDAARLRPDYAESYANWGAALGGEGDADGAVKQFRHALDINPSLIEARYNLGKALAQRGHPAEAIDQFRELLKTDPGRLEARFQIARILAVQGHLDLSLAEFQKILDLQPGNPDARRGMEQVQALLQKRGQR